MYATVNLVDYFIFIRLHYDVQLLKRFSCRILIKQLPKKDHLQASYFLSADGQCLLAICADVMFCQHQRWTGREKYNSEDDEGCSKARILSGALDGG